MDNSGTAITPAALFTIRGELEVLRSKMGEDQLKLRGLEKRLAELEHSHNEHDDRQDEFEHRLSAIETVQDRLLSGVTTSNLMAERTERHLLAIMSFLKIPGQP